MATVLDDALGSLLTLLEVPAVTAKLEVDCRRPAFLGRRFEVATWLESRAGRKLHLAGDMGEEGELVAGASGLFIQVEQAHFLRGASHLPSTWRLAARGEGGDIDLPW